MDELIWETNETCERERYMWGCLTFPAAPGIQPSNSLLAWGGDNIKNREEIGAKPRLLGLSLLHCLPCCVCWKYALSPGIWYWNDTRGVEDQAWAEPLWDVCFPVWIWVCRKFFRIFFSFFYMQFWYLAVLHTARINTMLKPQKTPPTHSRPSREREGHFNKSEKAFMMCQVGQFSVQSESWGFAG